MSLKAGVLANTHTDRGMAEFIVQSVKADQTQPITKITIAARLSSHSSNSVLIFVRLWLTVHLSFKGDAVHSHFHIMRLSIIPSVMFYRLSLIKKSAHKHTNEAVFLIACPLVDPSSWQPI